MKQIVDYLEESVADFIINVLKAFNQNVVVYRESDQRGGWFYVMDSAEYDLEWHRMSFRIELMAPITGVLTGDIVLERYNGCGLLKDERRAFGFNRRRPFGEALNDLHAFLKTLSDD